MMFIIILHDHKMIWDYNAWENIYIHLDKTFCGYVEHYPLEETLAYWLKIWVIHIWNMNNYSLWQLGKYTQK